MKTVKFLFIISFMLFGGIHSFAKEVNKLDAKSAGESFIISHNYTNKIQSIKAIYLDNKILFYQLDLVPQGFIIVSANNNLHPVIAYSFSNNIDTNGPLFSLLKSDMETRISALEHLPESILTSRQKEWSDILNSETNKTKLFEQWPEEGTSTTGGWLESNWTQYAPYNGMCPIDPVTTTRSLVGCPATAMGMIFNYHKTINNVQFTDVDEYYHNYAGRTFNIDADFESIGFPSFEDLNKHLDTLSMHWLNHEVLTDNDKAALSFACGVSANQVYTSEGSGTFEVAQALAGYHKFYCTTSTLYTEENIELFPTLINNIKDGFPAHLALVDEAWSTGHNIVVDGYNTDNYFHVNFGWGGSNNGWYLLPDEMPYSLTVIEGIIVNIFPQCGLSVPEFAQTIDIDFYPNPTNEIVNINFNKNYSNDLKCVEIYNNLGQLVLSKPINNEATISINLLKESGIYYFHIINNSGNSIHSKKIIVNK